MIQSPKEDIAKNEVVRVQEAQLQLKQIIIEDLTNGVVKKETERKIIEVIKSVNLLDKELVKQSLITMAKNNYWLLSRNLKTLQQGIEKEMRRIDPAYRLPNFNLAEEVVRVRNLSTDARLGAPVIESYRRRVRAEIKGIAADGAKTQEIRNGRVVSKPLRNYAEMAVRFEANLKDIEKYEGDDIVWISTHADSSRRCEQYQGLLYSIKGNTGVIDGIKYTPLSEAMAGQDGDGNGIITGYNCRHRLIPYQKGSRPPTEYDKATIRKERQIDQTQRRLENNIRNMKMQEKLLRANGQLKDAQALRKRWRVATSRYREYSFANSRPASMWRTMVEREELNTE